MFKNKAQDIPVEAQEAAEVPPQAQIPEETAVITMGLRNGINPFVRSEGPVTPHQLSIMHAYLGALLQERWLALVTASNANPSAAE